MPQLPIEQRRAPRNARVYPCIYFEADDKENTHEILNNALAESSSDTSEDSPIIIQRKCSRSKTMPVRNISLSDILDDACEMRQEHLIGADQSDHEDEEAVLGELMDATPYTRRHVDSERKSGVEFGLPSSQGAIVSDAHVGQAVRSKVPAMRQIVLQIPIEVPAEMSAEDFAVQVVKNSCAIQRNAIVVDLQVMLQGHGVALGVSTPTPVTATPTDSLTSGVSPYHSLEGEGSSCASWRASAPPLLSSPCPENGVGSNDLPRGYMPTPCIPKQHAYAKFKPNNMSPGVKASNDDARRSMVCCHWKNKGFCKLGANCKFMHPMNKQGVGPTRRKGSGDVSESFAAYWPMAPSIASTLSYGKNQRVAQVEPMLPIFSGGFPMMMPPPPPGGLASMLGLPLPSA